jgi:hypothetical protein
MIKIKIIKVLVLFLLCATFLPAQTINWARLTADQKHTVSLNAGLEHGVRFGAAYHYQLPAQKYPMLASMDFSMPSGGDAFDDFKVRMGWQVNWWTLRHFRFSTKLNGIFRCTSNELARLTNFGAEGIGALGYYRKYWLIAAEVGFDKAISTHFKHSESYRTAYPNANPRDGWYEPATGGNFYYGLQTGFSMKRTDIYLKGGRMLTQDFKTQPLVPIYAEIGLNLRF